MYLGQSAAARSQRIRLIVAHATQTLLDCEPCLVQKQASATVRITLTELALKPSRKLLAALLRKPLSLSLGICCELCQCGRCLCCALRCTGLGVGAYGIGSVTLTAC